MPADDAWHTLVHVCHRWRSIVFASPQRLNLQLLCTAKRPVKKDLDIWPELPLVITAGFEKMQGVGVDNIVAALKRHSRVCYVHLPRTPDSLLENIVAMEGPFPALTYLNLSSMGENVMTLPDSFLDGSVPQLRLFKLSGIAFPGLGRLLLSTHHLVILRLWDVPHSGYMSPDTVVTALSTLTRLKRMSLNFRSPRSEAARASRLPPPLTRVDLPALISLVFQGDSEYLEDFVSRFDAPLIHQFIITFFNQLVFDTPFLHHFISRTRGFQEPSSADVVFDSTYAEVALSRQGLQLGDEMFELGLRISCKPFNWQLSSLVQVLSSLPPVPTLRFLKVRIREDSYPREQQQARQEQRWDDTESTQWLELFGVFASVGYLWLSGHLVPLISPVLKELGQVLPVLQNLSLWEPLPSGASRIAIEQFVAARRSSYFPVTVRHMEGEGAWAGELDWAFNEKVDP
jgi:hypothetical protein